MKQRTLLVLSIIIMIVGITMLTFSFCHSQSLTGTSPEPVMDVSTKGKRAVSQSANNRCAVDLGFSGSAASPRMKNLEYGAYRDINDSLYASEYAWSGGSTAWEAHVIIGDTTIYGGRGEGYNCVNCESFGGICCADVSKDFFNEVTVFGRPKGMGIIANMAASWDELKWMVERTNAKWVVMGLESNLLVYDDIFPNGASYVDKSNAWIDSLNKYFFGIYIISDAPPVWSMSRRSIDFRNEISKRSKAHAVRMYWWDNDYVGLVSRDWQKNLDTVNYVFSTSLPADVAKMREQYPGKEIAVLQWGMKNQAGFETGMSLTVLGQLWLSKEAKYIVDNNIKVASYMSQKALIGQGDVFNNNGYTMQLIGKWFHSVDSACAVTFTNLNGVTGFVGIRGKNNYSAIIINDNDYSVNVPIAIDGARKKKKSASVTSVYGTALSLTTLLFSSGSSTGSFTVPMYSVSLVKF